MGGLLPLFGEALLGQHLAQTRMLITHVIPSFSASPRPRVPLDRQGQMIGRAADRHIAADINLGGLVVVASHTSRLLKAPAARARSSAVRSTC